MKLDSYLNIDVRVNPVVHFNYFTDPNTIQVTYPCLHLEGPRSSISYLELQKRVYGPSSTKSSSRRKEKSKKEEYPSTNSTWDGALHPDTRRLRKGWIRLSQVLSGFPSIRPPKAFVALVVHEVRSPLSFYSGSYPCPASGCLRVKVLGLRKIWLWAVSLLLKLHLGSFQVYSYTFCYFWASEVLVLLSMFLRSFVDFQNKYVWRDAKTDVGTLVLELFF